MRKARAGSKRKYRPRKAPLGFVLRISNNWSAASGVYTRTRYEKCVGSPSGKEASYLALRERAYTAFGVTNDFDTFDLGVIREVVGELTR